MEFFGLTYFGQQDFIKDLLRPEYKEPMTEAEVKPMVQKVLAASTCPDKTDFDVDTIRLIDCYSGTVNGFAYGSSVRLRKMKIKGVLKPFAPADIYRIPPTTSIEIGWWKCDPALANEDWYKMQRPPTDPDTILQKRYPKPKAPNTYVLEKALVNNKYASLF